MTSIWSVSITHFDIDTSVTTNLTEDFISAPIFTDLGSGQINNARIVLSADLGKHITKIPKISQFDRIRFLVNDGLGGVYNKVFDVKKVVPSEVKGEGTRVTLILVGSEQHLQKINYIKPGIFEGAFETARDIGNYYNLNKKPKQPTLLGHDITTDNELPSENFQTNIYDFGLNEEKCYNRLMEVVDKLGSSVDAGGALDFFDLKFDYSSSNFTDITMKIFSSGKNGSVIIDDTLEDVSISKGDTDGGIEAITGTNILAWGANDQGSLPTEFSRFKSGEQRFPFHPRWVTGETYQTNSRVQDLGIHYKSLLNNNQGLTPASNLFAWQVITTGDEYGNSIEYSPWTNNKAKHFINAGCDLGLTTPHFGDGCWDGNLVIWDDQDPAFQTWADVKALNPASISVFFKYNNQSSGDYRGLRCLVNGTGSGAFSGNDSNGRAFTNSIAEYTGTEWRVKYPQQTNLICAVISEGIKYRFSGSWSDASSEAGQNDCWHPYVSITNQPGIITNFGLSANSAVRVRYEWDVLTSSAVGLGSNFANAYKVGAWLNFRFPYPHNDLNSISEDVGDIYGGGTLASNPKEPATLDQQNMHFTHDGNRGFSFGLSSEDYGPISALELWTKLHFQHSALGISYTTAQQGNFNMRCYIYDTPDNILFQDFVIRFNNHWEPIKLPMSGFSIYRGRKPLTSIVASIIPPKVLEAQNIFEFRNIKQIVFQTQDSYDSEGRYNQLQSVYNQALVGAASADPFRRIDFFIDAMRFTKPLLVSTGTPTDRNIEPDFLQRVDIGNYDQLKSDALAELEKAKFQRVQYDIESTGRFDIPFGDSLFLKNIRMVDFSDSDTNQIKLVNKGTEYSITKPEGGKGGLRRKITGVRRFT